VQAFSVFVNRLQALGLMIGPHGHGRAGFNGTEHTDQSILDAILLCYPFGPRLLVEIRGTAAHVVIGPALIGGGLAGPISDLLANLLGVLREILEQNLGRTEQAAHPFGRKERSQSAAEAEAVIPSQDTFD